MSGAARTGDQPADRIQDGIYFRKGQTPGKCYRLLLINIRSGTRPNEARAAIAAIWTLLAELRRGIVRDLRPLEAGDPEVIVPDGGLTCLLGFGARLFNPSLHVPRLVATDLRPPELVSLRPNGVGTPFLNLPWAGEEQRRPGEADLALQFIAETELAVNRAVVEIWKLIDDQDLPLDFVTMHAGFSRNDRRSWIDFHDGLNNLESSQRRGAIEVVLADPAWMKGGTYMGVLRVSVDLAVWRSLPREHQEILVGRNKLTGCPLEEIERGRNGELSLKFMPGCPFGEPLTPAQQAAFRDPPRPGDPLVQLSHIHRSNHNRGAPDTDANNRVFRQGYEFLETLADGKPCLGLHFVSFQRQLARLTNLLRLNGWLRDVNFGGATNPRAGEPAPIQFLSVVAGGLYAVPPNNDPFPGAEIF
ncbi:MAG: Dyp-type peroxidase [Chloroflexi bacterium]|nr:Dyp-type peroxidase [Chloroflexota bacterium]